MVLSATPKFSAHTKLNPSRTLPARDVGEYQAWISTNGAVLQATLDLLKRMVLALVHNRPGVTKVLNRTKQCF
jgi:hypothetical protein